MAQSPTRPRIPLILVKPPDDALCATEWHQVRTHTGLMVLQWKPGVLMWRAADGRSWASETAGRLGWAYLGPAEAPEETPLIRHAAP